jgi:protein-S-isoprenylcysteine O-methyltransferase
LNSSNPLFYLMLLFPISELLLALFKRAKVSEARGRDVGSIQLLWIVIALGVVAAIFAATRFPSGQLPMSRSVYLGIVGGLFLIGFAIRWYAIWTLGKFFTVNVAIRSEHRVIDTGPYRFVRHPSYTGALICFLAVGLYMANIYSVLLLILPVFFAFHQRMNVEERALHAALGPAYADYAARTKRLLPWLY